ncbi:MAG: DUF262 domain-containing protein [Carboxylicivirga sp.]|jgi:hypothetical protein|nr:DUF262 domain-containing protein [Carboxylicivirga sp.]
MSELIEDRVLQKAETVSEIKPNIITVFELLSLGEIDFPNYQRPYKWSVKHVSQLINDVITFKDKPAYRLGTVVIHQDKSDTLNVVDGQQRTVTLLLVLKAIIKSFDSNLITIHNKSLINDLHTLQAKMPQPKFTNPVSIRNIQLNYSEIERMMAVIDEEIIHFLLHKCEVVKFVLTDVSEAFQFFDAQNARGKDLDPHDLLKAFHLREFSDSEKEELDASVAAWEGMQTKTLVRLFGRYLYRIKGWLKGDSARYFTKSKADFFKGITLDKIDNYPFTNAMRITHFYVEGYNHSNDRNIDLSKMSYPFQLDQAVINGKRFFEMTGHYQKVIDNYTGNFIDTLELNKKAKEIVYAINNYEGRNRDGDKYVRMLFDCALIYYYDKFGGIEISRMIEKLFIWAYKLRLQQQSVFLSTADNYVLANNVFIAIKEATHPQQVLNFYISQVEEIRINKKDSLKFKVNEEITKNNSLINIFTDLKYYHG